jgi:hypothetical protein
MPNGEITGPFRAKIVTLGYLEPSSPGRRDRPNEGGMPALLKVASLQKLAPQDGGDFILDV